MKTRQYIYIRKKNPKSRDFCFCCAARSHRSPQRLTSSDGFSLPPTDLFPHPHFIRHFLSFFFLLLLLLSVRPQYIAVVIRQSTSFFSPFIDCYRPIKRRKKNVEEKVHFGSRLFQLLGFPITWTDAIRPPDSGRQHAPSKASTVIAHRLRRCGPAILISTRKMKSNYARRLLASDAALCGILAGELGTVRLQSICRCRFVPFGRWINDPI